MSSSDERHDHTADSNESGVSRRKFLKGTGVALTIPLVAGGEKVVKAAGAEVKIFGPDKVNITLNINGSPKQISVEPRATLLDTLRNDLDTTGAKRVCDRATCGACTMIVDSKPVYSCTVLAIEAQAGRVRRERWGPRTLDCDIVRWGTRTISEPGLTIPHPEIANRDFWQRELQDLDARTAGA